MSKPFYVIGFMGSGKTSIKDALSDSWTKVDTDEYFERTQRLRIPQYFDRYGEQAFREVEANIIKQVVADFVFTGGGVVEREENMDWMLNHGTVVYLAVPFSVCWSRIETSDRPLVTQGKDAVSDLYDRRTPRYERAHYTIDGTLPLPAVVSELLQLVERVRTASGKRAEEDGQ